MQFVSWWCNFISIHDPIAVQVASGVFGGGSLLLISYILLTWILAFYGALISAR